MEFQKLINGLIADGWTQAQIARAVTASQGHISQLKNGKTGDRGVSFWLGVRLMLLSRVEPPVELRAPRIVQED
jgi:transcriptional regulator with XRE-family HTH domain